MDLKAASAVDLAALPTVASEGPWEMVASGFEAEVTQVDLRDVEEEILTFTEMISTTTKALTGASVDPTKASSPT